MNKIFNPTDILIPKDAPMEKWSVVACDQFSSEHEYWEKAAEIVGDSPSTLKMIIPEAFLEDINEEEEIAKISSTMKKYLDTNIFKKLTNSYVYVVRTQPDGRKRRGLVGAVDLEAYDFTRADVPIRASEGTVLDRLPPRIRVRRQASLELPHIMTFIDDKDNLVLGFLEKIEKELPLLYDFELMLGGGSVKGMQVVGENAQNVLLAMDELYKKNHMLMVMGDGNHSLAAAKVYWNELREGLSESERENHPGRFALVEVNNVYDDAIDFEAIHRVAFDVNPEDILKEFIEAMPKGNDYTLHWHAQGKSGEILVAAHSIADLYTVMQEFLDKCELEKGARVDYIHGDDSLIKLSEGENAFGLILPSMAKSELFASVADRGVFPKKSFSIGHARDKRYYLECREIAN